ncbi:GrpB family protein [Georgenia sp. TF02-10]|uniref:GrpB family protein n=1 Tax=Georgenia sp. TF02-10 TaxID=2917725 RepID=UPI001FA72FE9|nr:GrpB family protein [Georgenia sp. TF02-10]UNX53518.1 GrpB family protein [Georgenia sp. TF02-10]
MDEERAAYLDLVLVGGREPTTIVQVPYDPRWPLRFHDLAARVHRALGPAALAVEHIGSTAVAGLPAKPIVDMLLLVADVGDEPAYVPALEASGFALRVREERHRMLRTAARDVHLHVYEPGQPDVRDYLDLRDWLRASAADRDLYAATKARLARQAWVDMNEYADAKTDTVRQILGRARAWRCGPG